MIRRVERLARPLKKIGLARRRVAYVSFEEERKPELALAYSNGYVTVEISHDALDAYIEMTGDVPLPLVRDPVTGDTRMYDPRHHVRVIYDQAAKLREVATRSRDGLFVRLNFTDS